MGIRRDFPDLPPIWALGTAFVSIGAGHLVPIWSLPSPAMFIGGVLMIGGVGIVAWAALWFRRRKTTIEPREIPGTLIIEGPFKINRNPIYTGMALTLVGIALVAGTLGSLLVALVFPLIITERFIKDEEAGLLSSFGTEAERFFARTRRW